MNPLTAEQQKQVAENYNLIKYYCGIKKLDFEELSGDLSIALIQAVQTYPVNADFSLSTHILKHLSRCVGNLRRTATAEKRKGDTISFTELQQNQPFYLEDFSSVFILSTLKEILSKSDFEIFYLWHFDKLTYREIAEIKGVSGQRIHTKIKKINSKLQHFFSKNY